MAAVTDSKVTEKSHVSPQWRFEGETWYDLFGFGLVFVCFWRNYCFCLLINETLAPLYGLGFTDPLVFVLDGKLGVCSGTAEWWDVLRDCHEWVTVSVCCTKSVKCDPMSKKNGVNQIKSWYLPFTYISASIFPWSHPFEPDSVMFFPFLLIWTWVQKKSENPLEKAKYEKCQVVGSASPAFILSVGLPNAHRDHSCNHPTLLDSRVNC